MPTEQNTVVIESPTLDKGVKGYSFAALFLLAFRTLIVWGAIAILIPWFGIAYWMVLVALIGLSALVGPPRYALVESMNRASRAARTAALEGSGNAPQDEKLLRSRTAGVGL